jgi:hypothetical protein
LLGLLGLLDDAGWWATWAAARGGVIARAVRGRVIAVDESPAMLAVARRRGWLRWVTWSCARARWRRSRWKTGSWTRPPPPRPGRPPFKVADLSLAEFGRKEIRLAEHEMPGLMALREEYAGQKPLEGRPHHGLAAHDGADGGADRDAGGAGRRRALGLLQHLLDAGPRRRRGGGRPDGTVDDPQGVPVFAWKGETLEEYWWCTEQALSGPTAAARTRSSTTAATRRC